MRRLLIISPYFPPANTADMHRVRHNLSYLRELGWEPTVVAVESKFLEANIDPLLLETVPSDVEVIKVRALPTRWTRKVGLGAVALRSLPFYFFAVNRLLKKRKFDLIFFSTTQFPVLILGPWWKRRFGTPFVVDMQDPWFNEYYSGKRIEHLPRKYWFAHYLNKHMEPVVMKRVDGIISVSPGYCDELSRRYAQVTPDKYTVIPFGAFDRDFEVLRKRKVPGRLSLSDKHVNCVYVGRGGADMAKSLSIIFGAFSRLLGRDRDSFEKWRFYFVGTSYAPAGKGVKTVEPLARRMGVGEFVTEVTDRVPYFESLALLSRADIIVLPGSEDANYTASKVYPNILARKPLVGVFSKTSSVVNLLRETGAGEVVAFDPAREELEQEVTALANIFNDMSRRLPFVPETNWQAFQQYTAKTMTEKQVAFFEKVIG